MDWRKTLQVCLCAPFNIHIQNKQKRVFFCFRANNKIPIGSRFNNGMDNKGLQLLGGQCTPSVGNNGEICFGIKCIGVERGETFLAIK